MELISPAETAFLQRNNDGRVMSIVSSESHDSNCFVRILDPNSALLIFSGCMITANTY